MSKKITDIDIKSIAENAGLTYAHAKAVIQIEASGAGFDNRTGLILIQFEPHVFFGLTKKTVKNGVEMQNKEWEAFKQAEKIDQTKAMLSTSWGLGQIMGFNHKAAGYDTVQEMVEDFKLGEKQQFEGMIKFICADKRMYEALRNERWAIFAKLYNGPGYAKNSYDLKLEKAYSNALNTI